MYTGILRCIQGHSGVYRGMYGVYRESEMYTGPVSCIQEFSGVYRTFCCIWSQKDLKYKEFGTQILI